jgi:hypothetical protein
VSYFKGNGLYARVGSDFALGNGVTFTIYDHIAKIGADEDIEKMTNAVQLNFKWEF